MGSRTISRYAELDVSPATIRNEMADLEEMGYIFQPHTSAGRIPTDAGYRLYVNELLEAKEKQLNSDKKADDGKDIIKDQEEMSDSAEDKNASAADDSQHSYHDRTEERIDRIENVLKDMVRLLAHNTNYTSLVSMPQANKNRLKFVQLTQIEGGKLLSTIVLEGNIVRNEMIKVDKELDQQTLLKLNLLFNNTLNGLTLQEINFDMAARMAENAMEHGKLVADILNQIVASIGQADGIEIFTSGAKNIFKYPELSDSARAQELISTLEEKELLTELMSENSEGQNTGIQVYIGQETPVNAMKDCSVITATYEFEEGVYGKVGIIGPKRMDYEKVVDALKNVTGSLDDKFKKKNQ